ncbi:MAG: ferric reductase-like transmembrane domain-containing protein [Thermoplasmatota archaeon]
MLARRALACAAFLALAFVVAAAAQQPPPTPEGLPTKALKDTLCWSCHAAWTPPMRDPFIAIQPPTTTGAAIGTEFNWTVQFQMTWNPKPAMPHLVLADPIVDLSDAPSMRFGGGPQPVHGYTEGHAISIDATKLNQPQANITRIPVAAGVTALRWQVVPKDTTATGPDLVLLVVSPGGNQTAPVDDVHGAGTGESINFTIDQLQALGGGNWTIGAQVTPLAPSPANPTLPQAGRVDFTVIEDAEFDTAALKTLAYPHPAFVPGGGVALQKWVLKFVQAPADGEVVHVRFDTVAWFEHNPTVTGGDFGGITQSMDVPAKVVGGQPVLFQEAKAAVVRPLPVNGATLTTISEAVGYASAFLFVSSIVSGGMFGQATRRGLNSVFQSAKRRVAFHNFLSYGLTVAALAHMAIFLVPLLPGDGGLHRPSEQFQWTLGVLWGGIAMVAMFGLGFTGAFQVPMIRRWSYPAWKWWHYGLTVAAIAFTAVHMLLDGAHFPEVQETLGWKDPFYTPVGGP